MTGFVDDERRNEIRRNAKWLVAPPHTNEDLGITPVEVRHVDVPCIITRDGGLPEAGGKYALICEPNNVTQLKDLLEKAANSSEEDYKKISEATRIELLEELSKLPSYANEYKRLLESSR